MTILLSGKINTHQVFIDGMKLSPKLSQKIYNHSPDGFNWCYSGSGSAQLALAILLEFTSVNIALANYQQFKTDIIAKLPQTDFTQVINLDKYI